MLALGKCRKLSTLQTSQGLPLASITFIYKIVITDCQIVDVTQPLICVFVKFCQDPNRAEQIHILCIGNSDTQSTTKLKETDSTRLSSLHRWIQWTILLTELYCLWVFSGMALHVGISIISIVVFIFFSLSQRSICDELMLFSHSTHFHL